MSAAINSSTARRAIGASFLALMLACAGVAAYLPPMQEATLASLPRMALFALAIAGGALLHWVALGIAARRLERSVAGWVALAVLLFPIGGAAALLLLGLFSDEHGAPAPAPGA